MNYHGLNSPRVVNGAESPPSFQAAALMMRGAFRVLPSSPMSPRDSDSDSLRGSRENFFASVLSLRDEQERVQKKTFTNWMNSYLAQNNENAKIVDLFTDIKDGIKLLTLLENVSGVRLPKETRRQMQRVHFLSNVRTALEFLESRDVKLVNINASDIVDGKPSIVLGLIWTIILYFQIEEQEDAIVAVLGSQTNAQPGENRFKGSGKKALLAWSGKQIGDKYGIPVEDFGPSWRDGRAFNALVHNIDPNLVDMDKIRTKNNKANLENAFNAAEKHLGIPRLLDPEDVDVPKPDEKSIMTYVAQFLKSYPDGSPKKKPKLLEQLEEARMKVEMARLAAEKEQNDLDRARQFPKDVVEAMGAPNGPVRDGDYQRFKALKARLQEEMKNLEELKRRGEAGKLVTVKLEDIPPVMMEVLAAEQDLQAWKWKLDCCLPGEMGKVGKWLSRAEKCLYQPWPTGPDKEVHAKLSERLQEHKQIFRTMDEVRLKFHTLIRSNAFPNVPKEQIQDMEERLNNVYKDEPNIYRKLDFTEHKFRIINYFLSCEEKLKQWVPPYGPKHEIEPLLEDYTKFVIYDQLYDKVDKAFDDFKRKVDDHKKRDLADNIQESQRLDRFVHSSRDRWEGLCKELQFAQPKLNEVLSHWRQFNQNYAALEDWIPEGEKALGFASDDRKSFFSSLDSWEDRHTAFNESSQFLIDNSTEPVGNEIKQKLQRMSRLWKKLFDDVKEVERQEENERQRREHRGGMKQISDWLTKTETLLDSPIGCSQKAVADHLELLQQALDQLPSVEDKFKETSAAAQALVDDSPQEAVNEMYGNLKVVKDRLEKVRKDLPDSISRLNDVSPDVSQLESGLSELRSWIDEGSKMLDSHRMEDETDSAEERLQKHRAHFSESAYFKTMLDDLNTKLGEVGKSAPKNLRTKDTESKLRFLKQNMQEVCINGEHWDNKLDHFVRLWTLYDQAEQATEEWITEARAILGVKANSHLDHHLRQHVAFFEASKSGPMRDVLPNLLQASREVEENFEDLRTIGDRWKPLQQQYNSIMFEAPKRQHRLEFRILKDKLDNKLRDAEIELDNEQHRIENQDRLPDILQAHEEYFENSDFHPSCRKYVEDMLKCSQELAKHDPTDNELKQEQIDMKKQYNTMCDRINQLHLKLKNLPQKWRTYNQNLSDVNNWVTEMDTVVKSLERTDLPPHVYQEAIERFDTLSSELEEKTATLEALPELLDELLSGAPVEEKQKHQEQLDAVMKAHKDLSSVTKRVEEKIPTMNDALIFKQEADRLKEELETKKEIVHKQEPVDDSETARALLAEHESLVKNLNQEIAPGISADINRGKSLGGDGAVPKFVENVVEELESDWKEVNEAADRKLKDLQEQVEQWENFEQSANAINDTIAKAEDNLKRSQQGAGLEAIRNDVKTKDSLQQDLAKLQPAIQEIETLAKTLKSTATPEKQAMIEKQMSSMKKRFDDAEESLQEKLAELNAREEAWTKFNNASNDFADFLNAKEKELDELENDKSLSPAEKHRKAAAIASEVQEAADKLQDLDTQLSSLTANSPRTKEINAAKTKVGNLRKQYEKISKKAADQDITSSTNLKRYDKNKELAEELEEFLDSAEEIMKAADNDCESLEEVEDLIDKIAALKQKRDALRPTFEELDELADALPDEKDVQKLFEKLSKRWDDLNDDVSKKTDQLQELKDDWDNFNKGMDEFEDEVEIMATHVDKRLQASKDDVESQLNHAKTAQEQLAAKDNALQKLQSCVQKMNPAISDVIRSKLASRQKEAHDNLERLNKSLNNNIANLSSAVGFRKEMTSQLDEFISWVEKLRKRNSKFDKVQDFEVADALGKLKNIDSELKARDSNFLDIMSKKEDYCKQFSDTESRAAYKRFEDLEINFKQLEDMVEARCELCEKWMPYNQSKEEDLKRIEALQRLMSSADFSEEDVPGAQNELSSIRDDLTRWKKQTGDFEELIYRAKMTIYNQRNRDADMDIEAEIQSALAKSEQLISDLDSKSQQFEEISQEWQDISAQRDEVLQSLANVENSLQNLSFTPTNNKGLNSLELQLEMIGQDLHRCERNVDQLCARCQSLADSDPGKAIASQECAKSVEQSRDRLRTLHQDKQQHLEVLSSLWSQQDDLEHEVTSTIIKAQAMAEAAIGGDLKQGLTPSRLTRAIEQLRNAEATLAKQQVQLDMYQTKSQQVIKAGQKFRDFDKTEYQSRVKSKVQSWHELEKRIADCLHNLEGQQTSWDNIEQCAEEIRQWLDESKDKLSSGGPKILDANATMNKLEKFKRELPLFERQHEDLRKKVKQLEKTAGQKSIPALEEQDEELVEAFKVTKQQAERVADQLHDFSNQKKRLSDEIEDATQKLNSIRDQVNPCDDLSGSDEQLLDRLQRVNAAVGSLKDMEPCLSDIESLQKDLSARHDNPQVHNLAQQATALAGRYETQGERTEKIKGALENALRQRHDDTAKERDNLMAEIVDKLAWAQDVTGDRYSVEARLAAIDELSGKLKDIEEKSSTLAKKNAALMNRKVADVEPVDEEVMTAQVNNMVKSARQAQEQLSATSEQLSDHENIREQFLQWIKNTETKLKKEQVPQPSLNGKEQLLKSLRVIEKDVSQHQSDFEEIMHTAKRFKEQLKDYKQEEAARDVSERYNRLEASLKSGLVQAEMDVEAHADFDLQLRKTTEWIADKTSRLHNATASSKDEKEVVQKKLKELEDLIACKTEGQALVTSTVHAGESLFGQTSTEGRDTIRADLRRLRTSWNDFTEELSEAKSNLESNLGQWSTYDESLAQFIAWVSDTEAAMEEDSEPANSLSEKRSRLQQCKNRLQDVVNHEGQLENIVDKAQSLMSEERQEELDMLRSHFESINEAAKRNVRSSEAEVARHQQYQEAAQALSDWLSIAESKLEAASDASSDKHALQLKLDKVESVRASLPEGRAKADLVQAMLMEMDDDNSPEGQQALASEVEELGKRYTAICNGVNTLSGSHGDKLSELQGIESTHDQLMQWVKIVEPTLKEDIMKATRSEKEERLHELEQLLEDVKGKENAVDNFKEHLDSLGQFDPRLQSKGQTLSRKFDDIKRKSEEQVATWQKYANDHKIFDDKCQECSQIWSALSTELDQLTSPDSATASKSDKEGLIERRKAVEDMISRLDNYSQALHEAVSSAERIYPSTSITGRDDIRSDLKRYREQYESAIEALSSTEKHIDDNISSIQNVDAAGRNFEQWLLGAEETLESLANISNSIGGKKDQLQTLKALSQDISGRMHTYESLMDKAKAVNDPEVAGRLEDLGKRYRQLASETKQKQMQTDQALTEHRTFLADNEEFSQWLSTMNERLENHSRIEGDRLALETRLAKLNELTAELPDGSDKLAALSELSMKVAANLSSQMAQEDAESIKDLEKQLRALQIASVGSVKAMDDAIRRLEAFDNLHAEMSRWVKQLEQQLRNTETSRASVDDKKRLIEKLTNLEAELLSKRDEFNDYLQEGDAVFNLSKEARVKSEVGLVRQRRNQVENTIRERLAKAMKAAGIHNEYDTKFNGFLGKVSNIEEELQTLQEDRVSGKDEAEQRLRELQGVREDFATAAQALDEAEAIAEKLYPDTSGPGREKVRQELGRGRERLDDLEQDVEEETSRCHDYLDHRTGFEEKKSQFLDWMDEIEKRLKSHDVTLDTLDEKKSAAAEIRALNQEVLANSRLMEKSLERAYSLQQAGDNSEAVNEFINVVPARFNAAKSKSKNMVQKAEQKAAEAQQYQDALNESEDWITAAKQRIQEATEPVGDRAALKAKLAKLEEMDARRDEGERLVQDLKMAAKKVAAASGDKGKKSTQESTDAIEESWEDYCQELKDTQQRLQDALEQMDQCDDARDELVQWLKNKERQAKENSPGATVDDKKESLRKMKSLLSEIKSNDGKLDDLMQKSKLLSELTMESQPNAQAETISQRYNALKNMIEAAISKGEDDVSAHEDYISAVNDAKRFLAGLRDDCNDLETKGDSKQDLQAKHSLIESLLRQKEDALALYNEANDAWEKMSANTSPEGREKIRQELRAMKSELESIFDTLNEAGRQTDNELSQMTNLEEQIAEVEAKLERSGAQYQCELVLRDSLDEKKTQLQQYKSLCLEIQSQSRSVNNLAEKSRALSGNALREMDMKVDKMRSDHSAVLDKARDAVTMYEGFVRDHEQYQSAYNDTQDWLNNLGERLSLCSDTKGDKHAIRNRLDQLNNLSRLRIEGEPKIQEIDTFSERVIPNTGDAGQRVIKKEVRELRQEWDDLLDSLGQTMTELETRHSEWTEFEESYEQCQAMIKDAENNLRALELKSTLPEKIAQVDKFDNTARQLENRQSAFDELAHRGEALADASGEKHAGKLAVQLKNKQEVLGHHSHDLSRRWNAMVAEHETFQEKREQARSWLDRFEERLQDCSTLPTDRREAEALLSQLQSLMKDREPGFKMVQEVHEAMQPVLANTAAPGREQMRRDVGDMQKSWDACLAGLNSAKSRLDASLAQWNLYEEGVNELEDWLKDVERRVREEKKPVGGLPEKMARLEKVKMLHMNVSGKQPVVRRLESNSKALVSGSQATPGSKHAFDRVQGLLEQYDVVQKDTNELLKECESSVKEHQYYTDLYSELQEQSQEHRRQIENSDQPGDRQSLMSKAQMLGDMLSSLEQIQPKTQRLSQSSAKIIERATPEECDRLRKDTHGIQETYAALSKDVRSRQAELEQLQNRWRHFDQDLDRLSDNLKESEGALRGLSEQQSNIADKRKQLTAVKKRHDEILSRQNEVDRINESGEELLQLSPDLKVSTRLSQVNARYNAMSTLAKDMLKKNQQVVQDHTEFDDSYAKTADCVADAQRKLNELRQMASDRYGVQAQIEKLNDFSVVREEGQILLQGTTTWADKTMLNTSPSGREAIKQAMSQLNNNWSAFVIDLNSTRTNLEGALIQWTEFDDNLDQIQQWLRDTNAKLNRDESQADLSEKSLYLQRAKALLNEIVAYDTVIQSVNKKMVGLESSGNSNKVNDNIQSIKKEYTLLRGSAEDIVKRQEALVTQHQEYTQSYMSFGQWLRLQREKLSSCNDTFGDQTAIQSKMQKAQTLISQLPNGETLMKSVVSLGEETIANTSPNGQTRIREEIDQVKSEFEDFSTELTDASDNLSKCHKLWEAYETSRSTFGDDMKHFEENLRRRPELKSNPQEKRQQLATYNRMHEDLVSKQEDLDVLHTRVQELLSVNPDSRLSHTSTQMTTRYQSLMSLSNELLKKIEGILNDHLELQTACDNFSEWATKTREELLQVDRQSKTREEVERCLPRLAALQNQIDDGAELLKVAEDIGDRTLTNTDIPGSSSIREMLDGLRRNFEEIRDQISRNRIAFDSAATGLNEFDRSFNHLDSWLKDGEVKLNSSDPNSAGDLSGKKAALERLRILASEMAAKKAAIDRLGHRARDCEDPTLNDQAEEITKRHARMMGSAKDNIAKLEQSVSGQEEYKLASERARDWLNAANHKLQRISDVTGSQRDLESRLEQLHPFKTDLNQDGQTLIDRVDQFANQMLSGNPPERDDISREVDSIHNEFAQISTRSCQVERQLEDVISQWHRFIEQCQKFNDWLREVDSNLKRHIDYGPDFESKQRQAKEFELILEDIYSHKPDLDKLREGATNLQLQTQDSQGNTKVLQYTSRYQSLQNTAQDIHQRLEALAKEHRFYEDAMEDANSWIESTTQRLLQCSDISGDQNALKDKIALCKDIVHSLDDGQTRLTTAVEAADRVLKKTPREGTDRIREQIDDLRQNWAEVNAQLNNCSGSLSTIAAKWNDYEELRERLGRWLQETERTVDQLSVPKSDIVEKKARFERFQNLQKEVDKVGPEFEDLQNMSDELQAGGPQPAVEEQCTSAYARFRVLTARIQDRLNVLGQAQQEYQQYQDALQKCEKWILQTSFKVMTQSSTPCNSLEATQNQMEKHENIAKEIGMQKQDFDFVVGCGKRVMENSTHNAEVLEEIQGELSKLDDEYKNLQEKSDQLGDRLRDNLGKWKGYKDQVQAADKFMKNNLSSWWIDKEQPEAESLDDAERQIEDTHRMLDKVQHMRSDIAAAAHRCEAISLGSSRPPSRGPNALRRSPGSRPRTPVSFGPQTNNLPMVNGSDTPSPFHATPDAIIDSPFARQAEKVNKDLKDNADKMERRLEALADENTKWENANQSREDFHNWLKDKENDLKDIISGSRPGKMDPETAERELNKLQALAEELQENAPTMQELEETYSNLTQHKPSSAEPTLRAIRDEYEDLLNHVSDQTGQRKDFLEQYGRDQEMEELIKKVQAQQMACARADNTKGTQTLRHHGTQTPAGSARSHSRGMSPMGSENWLMASARTPDEDPIESLRRTLQELDKEDGVNPTFVVDNKGKARRTQTDPELEQKQCQTSNDEATQTKRSKKPTRQAALKSLLNTVRSIKEELARAEDSSISSIPPLSPSALQPPTPVSPYSPYADPLSGLRSPIRSASPTRYRNPEMESVRRSGPVGSSPSPLRRYPDPLESSGDFDDEFAPPSERGRPGPVGRSPSRSVTFSPPVRGSPASGALSPEPYENPIPRENRGVHNRYGLEPDAFAQYIPTKPHWRGEAPIPSNGYGPPASPAPPSTRSQSPPVRRKRPPSTPVQVNDFVRDYDSMLHDQGNAKSRNRSGRSGRSQYR